MKRTFLIICAFISSLTYSQQDSDVLCTVDATDVSVLEFKNVYEKNLSLLIDDAQKDVKNYLDLYIKFKLKLAEARRLKLDTTRSHKREIETYKNQLIAPYLRDTAFIENRIKKAYYRTKYKVNASHILVKIPKGILRKDTLQFYAKIMKARKALLSGTRFAEVALQYSEDQSVASNLGNLGYFTAFKMVHQFEDVVYETGVNEVSQPFKTRFGYHVVQVNDLQLSQGEVEVAHILITDKSAKGAQQIDSVYVKLRKGEDFNSLVLKYSNDNSSIATQGRLPKFGEGRMLLSFEKKAFELEKEGEFTKPFLTKFGWHIVKLIKKYPVKSFKEMRSELRDKVNANGGARLSDAVMLDKLKKRYKIDVHEKAKRAFDSKDIRASSSADLNETLLTINNKQIAQDVFFEYILNRRHKPIEQLFEAFVNKEVLHYFKENLRYTVPKFARMLQEYEEGLVVFDLMQAQVWGKSMSDTEGLNAYFEAQKEQYSFTEMSGNKGRVMNDYQKYLEDNLLKGLKGKYNVQIHDDVLRELIQYYKEND